HSLSDGSGPHIGPYRADVVQALPLRTAGSFCGPADWQFAVGEPDRVLAFAVDDHLENRVRVVDAHVGALPFSSRLAAHRIRMRTRFPSSPDIPAKASLVAVLACLFSAAAPTAAASPAAVGRLKNSRTGTSTPKSSRTRAMTLAASSEWPPRPKKFA